jgi:hypothetical protein
MIVGVTCTRLAGGSTLEPIAALDSSYVYPDGLGDAAHVRPDDEIELANGSLFLVRRRRFKFTRQGVYIDLIGEIIREAPASTEVPA